VHLFAQNYIAGKVIDTKTNQELPFVNVGIKGTTQGTTTDVKGVFRINDVSINQILVFTYLGYYSKEFTITELNQNSIFRLTEAVNELNDFVVLPGINPADVVMKQAADHRKEHDPNRLNSYSYLSYHKSVIDYETKINGNDTNLIDRKDPFAKAFFFLMETVTEKKYRSPDKVSERVIANKISGLKNENFSILSTQLQSFSFYENYVKILEKEYLSPLTEGNTKKYLFTLSDTVFQDSDTIFVVQFQPRKNTNFDGLKGIVYVDSKSFALHKVTASPVKKNADFNISILQEYKRFDSVFFPVKLSSNFYFKNITIGMDSSVALFPIGKFNSELRDIKINPEIPKKEFDNVILSYDPNANFKSDEYWNGVRFEPLTDKDSNTYKTLDSISKANNLQKKINTLKLIQTESFPIGKINFEINRIFRYRNYEGIRVGGGFHTNDRLSTKYKFSAFYGYGFGDKEGKYGSSFKWFWNKFQSSYTEIAYRKDIDETGTSENSLYQMSREERFREIYLRKMDKNESYKIQNSFRVIRYGTLVTSLEQVTRNTTFAYQYENNIGNEYKFLKLNIGLRYALKEKLREVMGKLVPEETPYPILYLQFQNGIKAKNLGDYQFNKIVASITYQVKMKLAGTSYFKADFGFVDRSVPISELFYSKSNSANRIALSSYNTFETMFMNEFLHSTYTAVFYRHDFGHLLFKNNKFKPEINLVHNMLMGSFLYASSQSITEYKIAQKPYLESGILVNNILNSGFVKFGFGVYYRYGYYSKPNTIENVALKLAVVFGLF